MQTNSFYRNLNRYDNLNTNSNSTSTSPVEVLHGVRSWLLLQRESYISENERMLNFIDRSISNMQPTIETNVMTNDEILQYTTCCTYGNIANPSNSSCGISHIVFATDTQVCRLPCGHLFNGQSICYYLSHVSSLCPMCNANTRLLPSATFRHNIGASNSTSTSNNNRNRRMRSTFTLSNLPTSSLLTPSLTASTTSSTTTSDPLVTLLSAIFNNFSEDMDGNLFEVSSENTSGFENNNGLSDQRIRECTEQMRYDTIINPLSSHCPISYVDFSGHMLVCQIKECKHIFAPECIKQWLATNATCPVCRLDLRERNSNTSVPAYDASMNSTQAPNTIPAIRRYRYR